MTLWSILLAVYEVAVGLGILGWWAFEWASHGRSALLAFGLSHIIAELGTTFVLLLGGISLLLDDPRALGTALVGLGMLLYATLNASGQLGRESRRLGTVMIVVAIVTGFTIAAILLLG